MMNFFISIQAVLLLLAISAGLPAQAEERPSTGSRLLELVTDRPLGDALVFVAPRPPDNLGAPGQRTDGAGSRGCGDVAQALTPPTDRLLTALVPLDESTYPNQVFSKTSAERPTLWVYVPYQPPHTARFVLLNSDGDRVYEANVELPDTAGVIGLSLPDTVPPLEPGEPYRWFFKVYCQSSPPPLAYVEGSLQRDALPTATAEQLAQMSPRQQVNFYAANGLWHDALTAAAELHHEDADDTRWADLLQAVGLEELSSEPIVGF